MSEIETPRSELHGGPTAKCYIDRSPSGLWYFYSDDWRGLMVAAHDLPSLLGKIPEAGKVLYAAMQEWHAKTPYTEENQLRQMKIYEEFFADLP